MFRTPAIDPSNPSESLEILLAFYSRPRGERFPRVKRWRLGYNRHQVDVFADRVALTIGSTLAASEAYYVTFTDERGGYDFDDIDNWLAEVEMLVAALGR